MANKTLFQSIVGLVKRPTERNEAGGIAYELSPKQALAQLAATGTFGNAYYVNAGNQLEQMLRLIDQVDDNQFLAQLAVYARERGGMKDMPAALLVVLSTRDNQLLHKVFDRVVDNGRLLRTVFQMVRSGHFQRRGLSSSLQRAFQNWLNEASVGKLLSASIGNDPSLRDILRMARPKPKDNQRRALFGWLTETSPAKWAPASDHDLPDLVKSVVAFRSAADVETQVAIAADLPVRWDLLADKAMSPEVWKCIARQMGPQALRMNLNTQLRQGVFKEADGSPDSKMIDLVAEHLADGEAIKRSRQFPYQFLTAYLNAASEVPQKIKAALHQAAELACGNVPELPGPVLIGVDTSGSMSCPVTGWRERGATSRVRCVDVAALFAAAILRKNPDSIVIPFDTRAYHARFDPQDTILSLADRLARYGGGGTDCSIPLAEANLRFQDRPLMGCIIISDNESWITRGRPQGYGYRGSTEVLSQWEKFSKNARRRGVNNPKLVCVDIQPYTTTQAPERADILNIGGFSDAVFEVVRSFIADEGGRFVSAVEAVKL